MHTIIGYVLKIYLSPLVITHELLGLVLQLITIQLSKTVFEAVVNNEPGDQELVVIEVGYLDHRPNFIVIYLYYLSLTKVFSNAIFVCLLIKHLKKSYPNLSQMAPTYGLWEGGLLNCSIFSKPENLALIIVLIGIFH